MSLHNAYGARSLIAKYAKLRSQKLLRIPELVWHHGWIPEVWNYDIDLIVGESGQTSELAHLTYLVSRKDQEGVLRASGVEDAYAVGLPFAYSLKMHEANKPLRLRKSIVVAPGLHGSFSPNNPVHIDSDYLDFLEPRLRDFDYVRVMMNCDDIRMKRHQEWERRGIRVIQGGCESDSSSLVRLADIFRRFDVLTTNDFGSHIVYAASAGCQISICGPKSATDLVEFSFRDEFYRNRPDLGLSSVKLYQLANDSLDSLGLTRDISEAVDAHDWGLTQIGHDCLMKPEDLRELFFATYSRHTTLSDQMGLRPLKKKLSTMKSFVDLSAIKLDSAGPRKLEPTIRNIWSFADVSPDNPKTLMFTDSGQKVYFRPRSSDLQSLHQVFAQRELETSQIENPKRILDLGCYAGYSTIYLLNFFPNAQILAVEAQESNHAIAELNLGKESRVTLLNKAVWPANEPVSLIEGTQGERSTKTIPHRDGLPTVDGMTVGRLLHYAGWESVDLMKMDIEGAEYELLESQIDNIADSCSFLLVSFYSKLARQHEVQALTEKLIARGEAPCSEMGRFTLFDFR